MRGIAFDFTATPILFDRLEKSSRYNVGKLKSCALFVVQNAYFFPVDNRPLDVFVTQYELAKAALPIEFR